MFTNTTQLTDEQQDCIKFNRRQHLLIKGPAGSGKTVVLVLRGTELSREQTDSARFITFTNALTANAEQLSKRVSVQPGKQLDVRSYHSWCAQCLKDIGVHLQVVERSEQARLLTTVLETVSGRAYNSSSKVRENPLEWWRDEVAWIKGSLLPSGRPITSLDDYISAARIGRGAALQAPARVIVWDVFELYHRALSDRGRVDWEDLTRVLLERYQAQCGVQDYRQIVVPSAAQSGHLLIDEAQDLHQLELLALARFARLSLTLVADQTQKIYKTTFSWASVGLTFDVGNVRSLSDNFRSTRQIVELALPLMPPDEAAQVRIPRRNEGPLPTLYVATNTRQEDALLYRLVAKYVLEHPGETVGVFARGWDQLEVWQTQVRTQAKVAAELIRRRSGSTLTPGVKLTTLHSSKGLEFDAVVLPRLVEGILPTTLLAYHGDADAGDIDEHYAYEQRLMYVAITRARRALFLITSGNNPSRFLQLLDASKYERAIVPDL